MYMTVVLPVILCLLAMAKSAMAGENDLFDSEKIGHLYNIERRRFLGKGWASDASKKYMVLVEDPKEAMDIKMQNVMGDQGPYLLFLAVNHRVLENEGRGPASRFKSLTRHTDRRWGSRLGLNAYNDDLGHMFSVSVPAFMDTQAFHIFNGGKCVGYNNSSDIVELESCYDKNDRNRDSQLWVWVTKERREKDYKKGLFSKDSKKKLYMAIEKEDDKDRDTEWQRDRMRAVPILSPRYDREGMYRDREPLFVHRFTDRCRDPEAYYYCRGY